jgi:hypothetical protein
MNKVARSDNLILFIKRYKVLFTYENTLFSAKCDWSPGGLRPLVIYPILIPFLQLPAIKRLGADQLLWLSFPSFSFTFSFTHFFNSADLPFDYH